MLHVNTCTSIHNKSDIFTFGCCTSVGGRLLHSSTPPHSIPSLHFKQLLYRVCLQVCDTDFIYLSFTINNFMGFFCKIKSNKKQHFQQIYMYMVTSMHRNDLRLILFKSKQFPLHRHCSFLQLPLFNYCTSHLYNLININKCAFMCNRFQHIYMY